MFLILLNDLLRYALLYLSGVGVPENGGSVRGSWLPFGDVLLLIGVVHLDRAHGWLGRGGGGRERFPRGQVGSRASQMMGGALI